MFLGEWKNVVCQGDFNKNSNSETVYWDSCHSQAWEIPPYHLGHFFDNCQPCSGTILSGNYDRSLWAINLIFLLK